MKDKVKFKFGESVLLNISFSCKHCAFANKFDYNCEVCPVLTHAYNMGVVVTDNDAWWADSSAETISVITDDLLVAYRAYKRCKRIAAGCAHNKAREKTK